MKWTENVPCLNMWCWNSTYSDTGHSLLPKWSEQIMEGCLCIVFVTVPCRRRPYVYWRSPLYEDLHLYLAVESFVGPSCEACNIFYWALVSCWGHKDKGDTVPDLRSLSYHQINFLSLLLFSPSETPVTLMLGHFCLPQLVVGLFVSFISVILFSVFHSGEFLLLCLRIF